MGEFVPFEEVDHTADYALVARGRDLAELLRNASLGLCRLLADVDSLPPPLERRPLHATAPSRERLLVGWLRELLFLHETQTVVFSGVGLDEVTDRPDGMPPELTREALPPLAASGWADVVPADAAPDAVRAELKAVTYHDLEIEERDGLLRVRITFDT